MKFNLMNNFNENYFLILHLYIMHKLLNKMFTLKSNKSKSKKRNCKSKKSYKKCCCRNKKCSHNCCKKKRKQTKKRGYKMKGG